MASRETFTIRPIAEATAFALLAEIGAELGRTRDVGAVVRVLQGRVKWLVPYESVAVLLRGGDGWTTHPGGAVVAPDALAPLLRRAVDATQRVALDAVDPPDAEAALGALATGPFATAGSLLILPLEADEGVFGLLILGAVRPQASRSCPPSVPALLQLHVANALRSVLLFERERDARIGMERAVETRDRVLQLVSHDLRTPLSSVVMASTLLASDLARGDQSPASLKRRIDTIDAASRQMRALLDELLDAASLEAGRVPDLRREPVDLVALAKEVVAMHDVVAAGARVLRVDSTEAQLVGAFDRSRLWRVIDNLVGNAVKYSAAGSEVRVTLTAEGEPSNRSAVITVSDRGVGIPAVEIATIFEPFRRGSNVAGQVPGTGLGLSGAQQIVIAHGGRIEVRSAPGDETTFTLRLPLAPSRDRAPATTVAPAARPSAGCEAEGEAARRPTTTPAPTGINADVLADIAADVLAELPAAILVTDLEGRIVRWLGQAEAIFGYPAEEAVGRPVNFVHRPDIRERMTSVIIESIIATGSFTGEIPCLKKDGTALIVETSARTVRGADGQPRWLVGINRDVTDRNRIRKQQEEQQRAARLQTVTGALAGALTPEEVAEVIVRHGLAALGARAGSVSVVEEVSGTLVLLGAMGYPEDAIARFRRVELGAEYPPARVVQTARPLFLGTVEERRKEFPGLASLIQVNGAGAMAALPLFSDDCVVGAIGFNFAEARVFDEADRVFASTLARLCGQALERSRLYARARDADRRKDEFLAVLGHELRNPLAPIVTALELMKMRAPDACPHERAIIERQVKHVGRLVDDLLDISRITRGRVELRREVVDVAEVIARAVETASPLLEAREHRLTVEVPTGLLVNADPTRIAQCVANVLINAANYTPRGGRVAVAALGAADRVMIEVRDDGVGLTPDLQARLFEPFVRGRGDAHQAPAGLGLGLAIVKALVTQHGGEVAVESAGTGCGTTLRISLPRTERPASASAAAAAPASELVAATPRRKVLVVDDNVDAGDLLGALLEALGHEVRVAADGPRALVAVQSFVPDVALLDIGMPGMDGYELAGRLRAIGSLAGTRLIALTGYGQTEDVRRALAAGFDAHLVKPVAPERLAELIAG